jgi:CHAT domain-containing protein
MRAVGRWLVWLSLAIPTVARASETRFVPRDFPTIKSAVLAASPGDTVEVDDGYYFEDTIILDKPITLKARTPFRAVIYGTGEGLRTEAILVIKSSVDVEGFILKNGTNGILQRNSPDVDWTARNLAILNMSRAAISINDPANNIGRGRVENVIVDHCKQGVETNDAYGIEVVSCLISRCQAALWAYNHVYFRVNHTLVWNCRTAFSESTSPVLSPRTNVITRGQQVVVLDGLPGSPENIIDGILASPRFFGAPVFSSRNIPDETISRGIFLLIAGDIFLARGEFQRPGRFYEAALRVGQAAGFEELDWRADFGLAACFERRGQLQPALEHYRRALNVFEELRGKFPLRLYNPGFFEDKLAVHFSLIRLLREMHQRDPSRGYLEEVFAVMERSKARGFMDSLEEAELGFSATATPDIRQEEARIANRIAYLQTKLHNPYLSKRKWAELELGLAEAENNYTDLLIRIRRKIAGGGRGRYAEPLGYPEIRERILEKETALVEYMLGQDYSVGLMATAKTLSAVLLPGRTELARLVGNYLSFLTLDGGRIFRAHKGGQRLNDVLLGPFRTELREGIRKIIIVPDGQLFDLPFEALVDEDGRFLVEKYEFSYVHSASALVRLHERIRKRTGDDLLAVGISQPPRPRSSVFGSIQRFPRLRHVSGEVRAAERSYVGGKKHVLLDASAEEGALKRLNWRDYRIIHFAVHGIFDDENWTRSCLLLWQNGETGEDGYLQVRDLIPLSLASDLVVLSACQTAKASLQTGEGLIGLSNIFLFAGSRSVMVSQWNINDKSTAVFMGSFYELLASGLQVGEALRQAKIKMVNSRYGHPFHWAAFALIGCSSGSYSISNSREAEASSRLLSSRARTVQR